MKHALLGYKKYIKRSKCDVCEIMLVYDKKNWQPSYHFITILHKSYYKMNTLKTTIGKFAI